jgi:hypothetical protein
MPTRKRQGGGGGNSYSFGAAVGSGTPYAAEVVGASSCMGASRAGMIAGYSPPGLGGLPGMVGGRRSRRSRRKGSKRRHNSHRRKKYQHGGRYTTEPGAPYSSTGPNVFTPTTKLGCNYQGGGGGVDLAAYSAPTAGYGNQPSSWVGATGAPALIQVPYNAGSMNPACLKTGGARRRAARRHGAHRRGKRNTRRRKH